MAKNKQKFKIKDAKKMLKDNGMDMLANPAKLIDMVQDTDSVSQVNKLGTAIAKDIMMVQEHVILVQKNQVTFQEYFEALHKKMDKVEKKVDKLENTIKDFEKSLKLVFEK